jgi:hypothetical protein
VPERLRAGLPAGHDLHAVLGGHGRLSFQRVLDLGQRYRQRPVI